MYRDDFLNPALETRRQQNAFRTLATPVGLADFSSNDYLGIVHNGLLNNIHGHAHGSTGSRLLSGNSELACQTEDMLAAFHDAGAALLFNAGYDANLGLLSCVPQKGDTIVYDQLSHASLRDGIRLSLARSFKFAHNNLHDLERKLRSATGNIFVVTESVFSMDGDQCPLPALLQVCEAFGAHLVLDEAHAVGVVGTKGEGLAQMLNLHHRVFARIYTFGKAVGCHGAVVAGSARLKDYLLNFARSLVFSTALPPAAIAAIRQAYRLFPGMNAERQQLEYLVSMFQQATLPLEKLPSQTAIQGVIVPGNQQVKQVATRLQQAGYHIRPIMYPTVPKGRERLRIVLHAFNSATQLEGLVAGLQGVDL